VLLRTIAVALLACLVVAAGLVALDLAVPLPSPARSLLRFLPAVPLLLPAAGAVQALRKADDDRLALLLDERGGVGNVASTLRAPNATGPLAGLFRARAAAALRSVEPRAVVPMEAGRLWGLCFAALVLAGGLAVVPGLGDAVSARWLWIRSTEGAGAVAAPGAGTTPFRVAAEAVATLGALEVTVRAPAYADLPEVVGSGDEPLSALPGSTVEIRGDGTARPPALNASIVGGGDLRPRVGADGWAVHWTVGPEERGVVLSLTDGDSLLERRILALRPLRDRPPSVTLQAPVEDMVLAAPTGAISIAATARDDFGVADLALHWVRSRGSGESFDFEEGTWSWDRTEATRGGRTGERSLALDELGLEPGDVLHVRATATDGNDVTGPGRGVSATRQIRISDEDDLSDVTTLIGFPMEREREPLLSQRMIILLTEELLDSAGVLGEDEVLRRAEEVANEQARLRGRVGEQIFSRATGAMQDPEAHLEFEDGDHEHEVFLDELEARAEAGPVIDPETGIATIGQVDILTHDHDSDPIVAINRSLLMIYNDMWEAESDLRVARLRASLVPQNRALDALQALREGERVFVRGRVSVAPVDVPGTRGTGEIDEADPASRSPAPPSAEVAMEVAATVEELLAADVILTGRAASVRISGLALDLLEGADVPGAAEALARASAHAGRGEGGEVVTALEAALRALRDDGIRAVGGSGSAPASFAAARYAGRAEGSEPPSRTTGPAGSPPTPAPFTFATVRYSSGDWDSAPLVPANLIHALAQYTALPVEPEGVIVDLSSPEIFDHPFLYLTGHLPVFFDDAESRNLVDFVERGGFIFIDDHNHDIDGAFHRSVTSEIERLFGSDALQPIPNDHELYSSFFVFEDGPPITGHELSGWGDGLIHRNLFQVEAGGRIGVLYSNKDYSSEWSYHADNKRFLAVDNTRFGVNILVYALSR
jgi:hypothetical protein